MERASFIRCQNCGQEVPEGECYGQGNLTLCEDCYLKGAQKVQACDPFAARSAELFRKSVGVKATEGLTALQKEIFECIQAGDKVTIEELLNKVSVSGSELENQLAVLRHCNLVKGQKDGSTVYFVPF